MKQPPFFTRTLALLLSLSLAAPSPALALRPTEIKQQKAGLESLEEAMGVPASEPASVEDAPPAQAAGLEGQLSRRRALPWVLGTLFGVPSAVVGYAGTRWVAKELLPDRPKEVSPKAAPIPIGAEPIPVLAQDREPSFIHLHVSDPRPDPKLLVPPTIAMLKPVPVAEYHRAMLPGEGNTIVYPVGEPRSMTFSVTPPEGNRETAIRLRLRLPNGGLPNSGMYDRFRVIVYTMPMMEGVNHKRPELVQARLINSFGSVQPLEVESLLREAPQPGVADTLLFSERWRISLPEKPSWKEWQRFGPIEEMELVVRGGTVPGTFITVAPAPLIRTQAFAKYQHDARTLGEISGAAGAVAAAALGIKVGRVTAEGISKANAPHSAAGLEDEEVVWQGALGDLADKLEHLIPGWQAGGVPAISVPIDPPIPLEDFRESGLSLDGRDFLLPSSANPRGLARKVAEAVETDLDLGAPAGTTYQIVEIFRPDAAGVSASQGRSDSRKIEQVVVRAAPPVADTLGHSTAAGLEALHTLGHTDKVLSVALSPDGRTVAAGSADGTVRFWDSETGALLNLQISSGSKVRSVAFSPKDFTFASGGEDGVITLWNSQGKPLRTLKSSDTDGKVKLTFSPDGQTLVSISFLGNIQRWDVSTGKLLRTLRRKGRFLPSAVFQPNGGLLTITSVDDGTRLWFEDISGKGAPAYPLRDPGFRPLKTSAFSPDGEWVASVDHTETIRVWKAPFKEKPFLYLRGHTQPVTSIVFSPNGAVLAAASRDSTIRLWRIPGGAPLQVLRGHAGEVTNIAFSPDGRTLASASFDRTVKLWDTSSLAESAGLEGGILRVETPDEWKGQNLEILRQWAQTGKQVVTIQLDPFADIPREIEEFLWRETTAGALSKVTLKGVYGQDDDPTKSFVMVQGDNLPNPSSETRLYLSWIQEVSLDLPRPGLYSIAASAAGLEGTTLFDERIDGNLIAQDPKLKERMDHDQIDRHDMILLVFEAGNKTLTRLLETLQKKLGKQDSQGQRTFKMRDRDYRGSFTRTVGITEFLENVLREPLMNAAESVVGRHYPSLNSMEIRIRAFIQRGELRIEVVDNGLGISSKVLSLLGKRVVSTKRNLDWPEGGAGRDVLESTRMASKYGWQFTVTNRLDKANGAIATLVIPHEPEAGLEGEARVVLPSFWKERGINRKIERLLDDPSLGGIPSEDRARMQYILNEVQKDINEWGYRHQRRFRTILTARWIPHSNSIEIEIQDEVARYQRAQGQAPQPFRFTDMPPPPADVKEWTGIVEEHLRVTGREGGLGSRILRGYLDQGQFTLEESFDPEVGNRYLFNFPLHYANGANNVSGAPPAAGLPAAPSTENSTGAASLPQSGPQGGQAQAGLEGDEELEIIVQRYLDGLEQISQRRFNRDLTSGKAGEDGVSVVDGLVSDLTSEGGFAENVLMPGLRPILAEALVQVGFENEASLWAEYIRRVQESGKTILPDVWREEQIEMDRVFKEAVPFERWARPELYERVEIQITPDLKDISYGEPPAITNRQILMAYGLGKESGEFYKEATLPIGQSAVLIKGLVPGRLFGPPDLSASAGLETPQERLFREAFSAGPVKFVGQAAQLGDNAVALTDLPEFEKILTELEKARFFGADKQATVIPLGSADQLSSKVRIVDQIGIPFLKQLPQVAHIPLAKSRGMAFFTYQRMEPKLNDQDIVFFDDGTVSPYTEEGWLPRGVRPKVVVTHSAQFEGRQAPQVVALIEEILRQPQKTLYLTIKEYRGRQLLIISA